MCPLHGLLRTRRVLMSLEGVLQMMQCAMKHPNSPICQGKEPPCYGSELRAFILAEELS